MANTTTIEGRRHSGNSNSNELKNECEEEQEVLDKNRTKRGESDVGVGSVDCNSSYLTNHKTTSINFCIVNEFRLSRIC